MLPSPPPSVQLSFVISCYSFSGQVPPSPPHSVQFSFVISCYSFSGQVLPSPPPSVQFSFVISCYSFSSQGPPSPPRSVQVSFVNKLLLFQWSDALVSSPLLTVSSQAAERVPCTACLVTNAFCTAISATGR